MDIAEPKSIAIGITGHRKLSAQQLSALKPAIKKAIHNVIYYHQNVYGHIAPLVFTSAIAIGADTLFANIALNNFDGELNIYLPFEKEAYLEDFDTSEEKAEFNRLLTHPSVKKVVCFNKLSDGDRDDHYLQTGKKVADDNDYLIAVWDEQKARGKGGTGDVVAYATSNGKNVLVINPEHEKLIIKANYLPHLNDHIDDQPKPEKFSDNIVDDYFNIFDEVAIINQRKYKSVWQKCFRIGWFAAVILSTKVAFSLTEMAQFILTIAEIFCLGWVVYLILKERREEYHKNYLQYRFIAERLRMNNLLYLCGYYPIKTETRVIHKAMREIESKYPVGMINKIVWLTSYSGDLFEWKRAFIRSFALSQAKYHEKRKHRLEKQSNANSLVKIWCLAGFAAVVVFHVVSEFRCEEIKHFSFSGLFHLETKEPNFWSALSFFLYLFIPTTLARFEAVKYLNDWERLITQSTYMNEFFSEISDKINAVTEEEDLYNLLTELNDNIYLENLDWEMFMINKNEEIT